MGSRLTPFSKLLITLLIVAVVVLGGRWVLNNTDFGKGLKIVGTDFGGGTFKKNQSKKSSRSPGDMLNINHVEK